MWKARKMTWQKSWEWKLVHGKIKTFYHYNVNKSLRDSKIQGSSSIKFFVINLIDKIDLIFSFFLSSSSPARAKNKLIHQHTNFIKQCLVPIHRATLCRGTPLITSNRIYNSNETLKRRLQLKLPRKTAYFLLPLL